MAEAIEAAPGVVVPPAALEVRAVRASGPGGQNVNKVSSKIELVVTLALIDGLSDEARERLRTLAGKRVDGEGRLHVSAQESRDQSRNLETAREKVRDLVASALVVPKPRRRTRVPRALVERRLQGKRQTAVKKGGRRRPGLEE